MRTGRELIAVLRESKLDDVAPPFLWNDPELLRFLNYAEAQACRRAHLLIDSVTASDYGTSGTYGTAGTAGQRPLCVLPIIANQATYYLSPKVIQVKRCQLQSMTYPLVGPVGYPELDDMMSGWLGTSGTVGTAGSGGVPVYFLNEPGTTITFIKAPSANDTAMLVVSRLPLASFTLQTFPEVDEKYHEGLLDWAAHLAFLKPDSETINLQLSKYYGDAFTAQFGPLPDAYSEKMRKSLVQRTRMRSREFGS